MDKNWRAPKSNENKSSDVTAPESKSQQTVSLIEDNGTRESPNLHNSVSYFSRSVTTPNKSYAHVVSVNLMEEFDNLGLGDYSKIEQKLSDIRVPDDTPVGLAPFYKELRLWEQKSKTFQNGKFYPYKLFE